MLEHRPRTGNTSASGRPVVAIIHYGDPTLTLSMVGSLTNFDKIIRTNSALFMVVDAGSPEPEFEYLHRMLSGTFPGTILLRFDKRADYSVACNWVWKAFPGAPLYFFLNNDLIIPTPAISRMIDVVKYDPSIGILTPLMNTHGPGQHLNTFIKQYPDLPAWSISDNPPTIPRVLQIDNALQRLVRDGAIPRFLLSEYAVAFSCVMIKGDVLNTLGGQDEMFPFGLGADDDLCYRAVRFGWKVATAMDTFVGHIGGASLDAYGGKEIRTTTTSLIRRRWPTPSEDLISVIIPTYNCGRHLWNCLSSLRAQTHHPKEIIVVDDGSKDETSTVLSHFNVVKVTNQTNLGASAARNKGFRVSAGRYVIFCDADATYEPTFLEELHAALKDAPSDIGYAYCDLRLTGRRNGTHYSGEWSEAKLKLENFICCPTLIRREHFTGFDPSLRRLQDWDLWLDMWMNHGIRGTYVNRTLYTSIERMDGISAGGNADLILSGAVVREKYGI